MFELLLKKFLGFRQDWWPMSSTSLSHKLLSYLSPCHLWPSQLYSGFSWKKHLGFPCVVCVQSMWWCSKVLDLMLHPLQLICACAEATANISGCLAAKFGQTFCRVFFQSARCSEILDNAEYPQIPPRQNFCAGKRPWLGNTEHTYPCSFLRVDFILLYNWACVQ